MGGGDGLKVNEGLLLFLEDIFHFSIRVELAGRDEFVELLYDPHFTVEELDLIGTNGANLG